MSEKFSKKKGVYLNLFFGVFIKGNILEKLILKVMNLKYIGGKPMVRIIVNCAKLFNIRNVKKGFLLKKFLDGGRVKTCLGRRLFFSWRLFRKVVNTWAIGI